MGYTKAERVVLPIAFLIMLLITLLLRALLLDKPEKIKKIPFIVITILMISGELIKQILGVVKGYDLWWIPLHFCSTFFIWFSLAEFTKGEFAKGMKTVAFLATLCLVVAIYLFPRAIISNACENIFADFSTAHSFFFHHLVILYFLLSLALKRVNIQKKSAYYWMACMSIYFIITLIFAYALNTNYFAVLYFPLEFFDEFRIAFGQVSYNLVQASVLIFAPVALILVWDKTKKRRILSRKSIRRN